MNYTKGEWKWQFDPLDPKGIVGITQNGKVIFWTQTLKNAQHLCQILNTYSDMYEALKELFHEYTGGRNVGVSELGIKADKAIAKAEGK